MAKFFNGKNWITVNIEYEKDIAIITVKNKIIVTEIDQDGFIVLGNFRARLYNVDYKED